VAEKIVITGIGVLSPIGTGKDAYWKALREGVCGFVPITLFEASDFPLKIAGEITSFDPLEFLEKKGLRTLDRSTRLLCSAAKLALDDARFVINDENRDFVGVSVGATFGSLHSVSQFDREGLVEGPKYVNPSLFPNTVINSPASNVSIRFGIKGFNTTISTGFCASLDAIIYASDFILLDRANTVLAGGVEELCEETIMMFEALGYLAKEQDGDAVCCPYDKRRNGFIPSEGASLVMLESLRHARERGANILALVKGYGNAFHTASEGDTSQGQGLYQAISEALRQASLSPGDIDVVFGCANSSPNVDRVESETVKRTFGSRTVMTAIKSMTGESFSASGVFAVSAATGAISQGFIPPTVNYRENDEGCDLDYVPGHSRIQEIRNALVISSDPYGNNSALILGKLTDE